MLTLSINYFVSCSDEYLVGSLPSFPHVKKGAFMVPITRNINVNQERILGLMKLISRQAQSLTSVVR